MYIYSVYSTHLTLCTSLPNHIPYAMMRCTRASNQPHPATPPTIRPLCGANHRREKRARVPFLSLFPRLPVVYFLCSHCGAHTEDETPEITSLGEEFTRQFHNARTQKRAQRTGAEERSTRAWHARGFSGEMSKGGCVCAQNKQWHGTSLQNEALTVSLSLSLVLTASNVLSIQSGNTSICIFNRPCSVLSEQTMWLLLLRLLMMLGGVGVPLVSKLPWN